MDKVLKEVIDCAVAYIDNILVFSPKWAQHLQHLRRVFHALCQAGLIAKWKKSHMGQRSDQYLSYWIGQGTSYIWAVPHKVASLCQAAQPQPKKDLQNFLGLASYHHH